MIAPFVLLIFSTRGQAAPPIETTPARLAALVEKACPLWVASWREKSPSFTVRSFRLVREGACAPELTQPFEPMEDESIRRRLYVCSPDGARCIDPHVLASFEATEDGVEAMFDADQGVALIDRRASTWSRLLFCGTSCGFHDAAWLDGDTIAVVGSTTHVPGQFDEPCSQEHACVTSATVTIIDLRRGRLRAFQGPESRDRFDVDSYLSRRLRGAP